MASLSDSRIQDDDLEDDVFNSYGNGAQRPIPVSMSLVSHLPLHPLSSPAGRRKITRNLFHET